MKFEYIAVNQKGEECNGVLDAESKDDAIVKLRGSGLYPTQVIPEGQLNLSGESGETPSEPENLEEKQAVEAEFLEHFTNLCKTLADPKLANATKLPDIKKAIIMAQLAGVIGLIEENTNGDKLNFSDETMSGIFDMAKGNMVLSNLFLVGGLTILAETISQS
jgi:hypothetical protein